MMMELNIFNLGSNATTDLSQIFDTVIVGGGPGGLTAALYAGRYRLNTLLIERALTGGQMLSTEWIENYPGFEEPILGKDLSKRMEAQMVRAGVHILRAAVESAELSGEIKILHTSKGLVKARTVILSTGTHPRQLHIPGEDEFRGKGISYCATCDGPFNVDKTIAVIGGGNTALQESLFLTKYAKKIYLLHRRDQFRADKILQEKVFSNIKIEPILNAEPTAIDFSHPEAKIIRFKKAGEEATLHVDSLFVFAGIIPNNELFKNVLRLDESGYVITDDTMESSLDGVFAAGDVRAKDLRQIATAVADGATAAHAAEKYLSGRIPPVPQTSHRVQL